MRFPVSVAACARGLVITPWLPGRLVVPVLWAPWDEIELQGPHWISYREVCFSGFSFAIPARVADRIRVVLLRNKRFDE